MSRSRNYCFTLNNPTPQHVQSLQDIAAEVRYIIFQKERGANGTLHIQGYLQFAVPRTLKGCKRFLPHGTHIEVARGSPEQNISYCSKLDTRANPEEAPFTRGEFVQQGTRNDLKTFALSIKNGTSDLELLENFPTEYFRFSRVIDRVRLISRPPRTWEMAVKCIWGPSGLGKTRLAYNEAGDNVFFLSKGDSNQSIWWDGYNGQESVIIDDFYG